jgi:malonate decarboxylase acyl carrier protein
MEKLSFTMSSPRVARGSLAQAIVGVVASGNLEVLAERRGPDESCTVEISTAAHGFEAVWEAVIGDFVRRGAGGLILSINDGGARPDMVALRLAQALRIIEEPAA